MHFLFGYYYFSLKYLVELKWFVKTRERENILPI